jgi:hypothetical protein
MTVVEKTCKVCHQVKSIENFGIEVVNSRKYVRNQCKPCRYKLHKSSPSSKERSREAKLKRKYGIDLEIYQNMKNTQNNRCAICESPEENRVLNVDHCHSSGKVRQLLCSRCNLVLGQAGDNISLLEKCILYLSTHNTVYGSHNNPSLP